MYTRSGSRDVDKRDYVSCKALVCGGKIKVTELAVGGLDAELPVRGYQGSHVSFLKEFYWSLQLRETVGVQMATKRSWGLAAAQRGSLFLLFLYRRASKLDKTHLY